jgi:hypothetical protein
MSLLNQVNIRKFDAIKLFFSLILLLSPLYPYLMTEAYNINVLLQVFKQTNEITKYPNAKLISRNNVIDSSRHCWVWVYRYKTNDDVAQIKEYYRTVLPGDDWRIINSSIDTEFYHGSEFDILFDYYEKTGEEQWFTLSITAPFWSLFEIRC